MVKMEGRHDLGGVNQQQRLAARRARQRRKIVRLVLGLGVLIVKMLTTPGAGVRVGGALRPKIALPGTLRPRSTACYHAESRGLHP